MSVLPNNPISNSFEDACTRKPFERLNKGLIWQVLNYKSEYVIFNGKKWEAKFWKFSMNSPIGGWETPHLQMKLDGGIQTKHLISDRAPFGNSPFWIKDISTGEIFFIDTRNGTAEKYDGKEKDFLRQKRLEAK